MDDTVNDVRHAPKPRPRQDQNHQKTRRKTRPLLAVIAGLLLLCGVGFLAYPPLSKMLYKNEANSTNAAFAQRMQQYGADEKDELYRRMVAYNQTLFETGQSGLVDAFSYEQVDFSLKDFGFQEEMIGYLNIPKMEIELPVYLGASRENLNRGAAHLSQTSLPVGGENTNAVIAAHRGMPSADMFRHIDRLAVGDTITLTNFRETLTYQVSDIAIIAPDDIGEVLIQPGEDQITLISCNPYGYNYERYVVYTRRVL